MYKAIFFIIFIYSVRVSSFKELKLLPDQINANVTLAGAFYWAVNQTEECLIKYINLHAPGGLHKNVAEHCKELKIIRFKGVVFFCQRPEWKPFLETAKKSNISFVAANTSCYKGPLQCYNEDDLNFLEQIQCQKTFKGKSSCTLERYSFFFSVYCSKLGLKDNDIANLKFPKNTSTIRLGGNQITDVGSMMPNVMNLPHLNIVDFSNNTIKVLPILPDARGRRRRATFSFSHNYITTLDEKTLASFLAYKEVRLTLSNNPLQCDCNIGHVLDSLRPKLPFLIDDLMNIFCAGDSDYKLRPWDLDYSHCKTNIEIDKYDILIAVTVAAILLFGACYWNLNMVIGRLDRGEDEIPTPWIHTFFLAITTRLCSIREMAFGKKGKKD